TGTNLTYQWRIGTINLVDGGNISGATTPTLTINPATISDTASDYNVVISGTFPPSITSNFVSLTINPFVTDSINISICQGDSILIGGVFQNTSGIYSDTIVGGSSLGCDSILVTTLLVNPIATDSTNATICQGDSILIGGVFQNTSGNYSDTIVGGSSLGCDSILVTTLLVNPIATSNINATICEGDSILIYGVFQNTSGIYSDTIVGGSSLGCDSIATTTLMVTLTPIAVATSNSPVCLGESINLYSATVSGSTYDWTGPNGFVSSNQNPIILSATFLDSGIYTLTVTDITCSTFSSSTVTVVINDCSNDTTVLDFNIP
ncbi:MAG: hypothetical protein COY57_00075, partial [Flavobacteriales bacterium CG_4_10_14_0_8_um_filter_32_5]